ncbi:hypothetical protein ACFSNO_27855 [Streptomyces cirratus]
MTRLDHNRAISQLARPYRRRRHRHQAPHHLGQPLGDPVPGHFFHAEIAGKNAARGRQRRAVARRTFIPTVAKRGAAIIEARGASSAASAANAALDHVHTWVNGTAAGDWTSMGVPSDGSPTGSPRASSPRSPSPPQDGKYEIVQGLGHQRVLPCAHRRVRGRSWSRSATRCASSA